jgi:hypothetical protein
MPWLWPVPDRPLYPVRRLHLDEMTGPLGIWQHAQGVTPDKAHGTCTDDVARALTVDLLHHTSLGWAAVRPSARRSFSYLSGAFDPSLGAFRNFRTAAGKWHPEAGSQDSQGRALLSIGMALRDTPDTAMRADARDLFRAAVPGARRLSSPRAIASAILACDAALAGDMAEESQLTFVYLVKRLRGMLGGVELGSEWPWPEETLTYENALLPHALIVAGRRLSDASLRLIGVTLLDWLIEVQTSRRGLFTPIGNDGWWTRGGNQARFDQQPIEATAMILAAVAAYGVTQDPGYVRAAEAAYAWFLGDNDPGLCLADVATGGCRDGLAEDHVNPNQGAESTLMWLTALEQMRMLRTHAMASRQARARGGVTILTEVTSLNVTVLTEVHA